MIRVNVPLVYKNIYIWFVKPICFATPKLHFANGVATNSLRSPALNQGPQTRGLRAACSPWGSGAVRMRSKRPWPLRNILAKIFTSALYQVSTVRKTSMTDDAIHWLLPKKLLAALLPRRNCVRSAMLFATFK